MNNNIYVLRTYGVNNKVLYKVGYSSNINRRIDEYLTYNPYIEVVKTLYINDGKNFEKLLHSFIKPSYKKEWYDESSIEYVYELLDDPDKVFKYRRYKSYRAIIKDLKMLDSSLLHNRLKSMKTISINNQEWVWFSIISKYYDKYNRLAPEDISRVKRLI